jgi:hypothetical protein
VHTADADYVCGQHYGLYRLGGQVCAYPQSILFMYAIGQPLLRLDTLATFKVNLQHEKKTLKEMGLGWG